MNYYEDDIFDDLESNRGKIYIMRGISGSGKSTLANKIAEKENGVIFSTDDFFMVDGVYKFNSHKIAEYHLKNQERCYEAMKDKVKVIIIDNTNLQCWEMKPYVDLAIKFGYEIIIKEPGSDDFPEVSIDEIMRRQSVNKKLSYEVVQSMLNRMQKKLRYYKC